MMKELSMHIMDITQNSISAGASLIQLNILEDRDNDIFRFEIIDDGRGMSAEFMETVCSPFSTTRSTRKVGLGIPMLEQCCVMCGGSLTLESEPGRGTRLVAQMRLSHIDRPPMGDIESTIYLTVIMHTSVDFIFSYKAGGGEYALDTRELREILEGVPLDAPDVTEWLKTNIMEGIAEIKN